MLAVDGADGRDDVPDDQADDDGRVAQKRGAKELDKADGCKDRKAQANVLRAPKRLWQ